MMVKSSRKIKKIILLTTKNDVIFTNCLKDFEICLNFNFLIKSSVNNQQESRFEEITESLKKRNIELVVKYSTNLHDREIKLSNGRIIKVGRGLDYFKPPEPTGGAMSLGFHDLDLRPCYETTIDVFHKEATKITK